MPEKCSADRFFLKESPEEHPNCRTAERPNEFGVQGRVAVRKREPAISRRKGVRYAARPRRATAGMARRGVRGWRESKGVMRTSAEPWGRGAAARC